MPVTPRAHRGASYQRPTLGKSENATLWALMAARPIENRKIGDLDSEPFHDSAIAPAA